MKNTSYNKVTEISEDELKALKRKISAQLSSARHEILLKYPFIGSIALRMDLIPVRDVRVRTACTDGKDVYFDISFYNSLTQEERVFVLAHEVWHAVLLHLVRCHTRIHKLFNIATDKEVNYMLKNDGMIPPKLVLMPEKDEEGLSAEEIYEKMLLKNAKQTKDNKSNSNDSESSNDDDNDNGASNGGSNVKGQFDKHIFDGDDEGDANGAADDDYEITDEYGKVGIDSDFRPRISKDYADRMREAIVAEAQRQEKMQGHLPAHIRELVKHMTTPQIKWQEVLAQFVTRSFHSGRRTWIPPNRRHIHRGLYIQRQESMKLKACVAIDTSGSTMNDRGAFLGELKGLVESFGDYELTVICCDAEVDSCETFSPDNPIDIENGFEMCGGGGTSFVPPFEYIRDNNIECDVFLYLTDGYGDAPEKNPLGIPVMWVITKDGTEQFCDWGEKLKLNLNDSDVRKSK